MNRNRRATAKWVCVFGTAYGREQQFETGRLQTANVAGFSQIVIESSSKRSRTALDNKMVEQLVAENSNKRNRIAVKSEQQKGSLHVRNSLCQKLATRKTGQFLTTEWLRVYGLWTARDRKQKQKKPESF